MRCQHQRFLSSNGNRRRLAKVSIPSSRKEVETILEEAERSRAESQSETGHWYYRIPCAGVRYYSFDAGEPGL